MHEWPADPSQLDPVHARGAGRTPDVGPRDVAVVFASANSSRQLDRVEAEALEAVFGPSGVPVVAVKGALGECGASAAAAFVAAVLVVEAGA